jgi:uncharacterized phage protein (TIGR01671 family)
VGGVQERNAGTVVSISGRVYEQGDGWENRKIMRAFEFRVWDILNKKMYYFPNKRWEAIYFDGKPWEFPNQIPTQFTSLLDKNGKKIFEGDIVKYCYFESWMSNNCEDIFQIVFYNQKVGAFRMGSQYVVDNHMLGAKGMELTESCEVVGNIFENGDLIK